VLEFQHNYTASPGLFGGFKEGRIRAVVLVSKHFQPLFLLLLLLSFFLSFFFFFFYPFSLFLFLFLRRFQALSHLALWSQTFLYVFVIVALFEKGQCFAGLKRNSENGR
jgi:hypothetical protein